MKIFFAAALATTVLFAPSANAQTEPTAKVFYGDLNVDSAAGQAALTARVDRAARAVCGDRAGGALSERSARIACYKAAVTGAMTQLPSHSPQYASR